MIQVCSNKKRRILFNPLKVEFVLQNLSNYLSSFMRKYFGFVGENSTDGFSKSRLIKFRTKKMETNKRAELF